MSRTRTPKAIARIIGQADKNPKRFDVLVDPKVGSIGPAPKTLSLIENAASNTYRHTGRKADFRCDLHE